jgi:hypothetical protein
LLLHWVRHRGSHGSRKWLNRWSAGHWWWCYWRRQLLNGQKIGSANRAERDLRIQKGVRQLRELSQQLVCQSGLLNGKGLHLGQHIVAL